MDINSFRSSLDNSFRRHINNDRIETGDSEKALKYKEYLSNIESLLENINSFPIDYWKDLQIIKCDHISELNEHYIDIFSKYLASENNLTLVLNFITYFFEAFIDDLPNLIEKEDLIHILLSIINSSDLINTSYSLKILSIIAKSQKEFGSFLIENGILDILVTTIQLNETAKSSLELFASLGTQIPDMNQYKDLIIQYHEMFPFEVIDCLEQYIPYEEKNINKEESIFDSIDFIFSYLESNDNKLILKTLLLIEHILQIPETALFLQNNSIFYAALFHLIENKKEYSSKILLCFIYCCYKSPNEISKLLELGILNLIKELLEEGSFQDGVFSSILLTALLADAEILDDIESILESNLIERIFSDYEQYDYFFSFILENIERSIFNECECDSNIIRQYLNSNEEICSKLEEIIELDNNSSIIAQRIQEYISLD